MHFRGCVLRLLVSEAYDESRHCAEELFGRHHADLRLIYIQRSSSMHSVMNQWLSSAKVWARSVRRDVVALWIAARDRRTPLAAKVIAGAIAAYALSPIVPIPDFIPVLGYLDDLLIVPVGILLAVRLIPEPLMSEFRMFAQQRTRRPTGLWGVLAIIAIWAIFATSAACLAWRKFNGR